MAHNEPAEMRRAMGRVAGASQHASQLALYVAECEAAHSDACDLAASAQRDLAALRNADVITRERAYVCLDVARAARNAWAIGWRRARDAHARADAHRMRLARDAQRLRVAQRHRCTSN